MASESFAFGPYKIDSKEVFYTTPLSYAFVNLRPVVPGTFFFCQLFCSINYSLFFFFLLNADDYWCSIFIIFFSNFLFCRSYPFVVEIETSL